MFNWLRRRSKPSSDPKPDATAEARPDDGVPSDLAAELYRLSAELAPAVELYRLLGELTQSAQRSARVLASELPGRVQVLQRALALVDRTTQAETWAGLQGELGSALTRMHEGDRAQNVERAIAHFEQALAVFTADAFPAEWSTLQSNLANAYVERIRGDSAENIERAIALYEGALRVRTRESLPQAWAETQNNLSDAHRSRIRGERAENIERALQHCEQALAVCTREASPVLWAALHNNLAAAYVDRLRGERAENIERALQHCEQALTVRTREASPDDWSRTQHGLAVMYTLRLLGERAENIERAIHHGEQALTVRTREAQPQNWAMTEHALGNAFVARVRGDRAENLEHAIAHFQQALSVRTRDAFPQSWAMTHNNLANAYSERIRGERTENLGRAIGHFGEALTSYTPETFPQACRDAAYQLGRLLHSLGRVGEARRALTTAHKAVEALRAEAQRRAARREIAEQNADLYAHLVACCLREGDVTAALEFAAAGKSRAFVDTLASAHLDLSAAGADDPALAADLARARALRGQIDTILAVLMGEGSSDGTRGRERTPAALYDELRALRDEEQVLWEDLAFAYPALTATQQAPPLSAARAQQIAAALGATLVEYVRHADGWCAFVVDAAGVRQVPLSDVDDLLVHQALQWIRRVESPYGRGRASYTALTHWHRFFVAPLEPYLHEGTPLILAPFGPLHLLPLAIAREPERGRYLCDRFALAFAPGIAALRVLLDQSGRRADSADGEGSLVIAYPGAPGSAHYLPNVVPEAESIAGRFAPTARMLHGTDASPDAVIAAGRDRAVIHFGCHGWFDVEQPEQSGLMLAGGWLTVQRIITELRLDRTRLATLAACVSGRAALRRGEEHVGLLQAVLTAGARAVVASLWPVHDAATRVLFDAFYTALTAGESPVRALATAVALVRAQSGWAHPYYWAAFQTYGLATAPALPVTGEAPSAVGADARAAEVHATRMRGEVLMDADDVLDDAMILMEQIAESAGEVLAAFTRDERQEVVHRLSALREQAEAARSTADLLGLAETIQRLVEDTPALRDLLLEEGSDTDARRASRTVTLSDQVAGLQRADEAAYVAGRRRDILNRMDDLSAALDRSLAAGEAANGGRRDTGPAR